MWEAIKNVKLGFGGFVLGGVGRAIYNSQTNKRMFTVNAIVIPAGSETDGPEEDLRHIMLGQRDNCFETVGSFSPSILVVIPIVKSQ